MAIFEVVTYFKGPYLLKARTEFCNHFFLNVTYHKVYENHSPEISPVGYRVYSQLKDYTQSILERSFMFLVEWHVL